MRHPRLTVTNRHRRILDIIATDRTFTLTEVRGETAWVGKCLHCNARLVVSTDGAMAGGVTIEHVVPKAHGGTDDLENLALACARCNHEKGIRHDRRRPDHPRVAEVIQKLQARRRERWRDPIEITPR